ncbi:MAG: lipoyl(octanoyl) transferase LipB [Dehalococcoidia bacterium]
MVERTSARPSIACYRAAGVDYAAGLRWQHATAEAVRGGGREALALIEHAPVYTMGRRGGRASLLVPPETLGAPLVDVERGGDVTWHGPGQLVGYPILHLRARDIRAADYVRLLEATLVDALAALEVDAAPVAGRPGVWVRGEKVAAIGVAIRGGVSMHGFALNVAPDLAWFDAIVPCGIAGAGVTSIERVTGGAPSMDAAVEAVRAAFEARFGLRLDASSALEPPSAAAVAWAG